MTKSKNTASSEKDPTDILVYPTNSRGTYLKGVAFVAVLNYGARAGQLGEGRYTYALVTRDRLNNAVEYRELKKSVDSFISVATKNDKVKYKLAKLLPHAGDDVGPMFANAPKNILLPLAYKTYVLDHKDREWWSG